MGIPEGEKKVTKEIFGTIMTENFPNLMSDTKLQLKEAQRKPSSINAQEATPRHIIF